MSLLDISSVPQETLNFQVWSEQPPKEISQFRLIPKILFDKTGINILPEGQKPSPDNITPRPKP